MTRWLIRLLIKDPSDTTGDAGRAAYATLGASVGIAVNLLLSAGKYLMGVISGSLAIVADAANNLSDAAGSIVALVSTRAAQRPVDADHPFGHGRMEYLGSLGVGMLIILMAFTLLKDAIGAILHPETLTMNPWVIVTLVLSILLKLWLYFFYKKIGDDTDNGTMQAASKDSLSDVLATGAVLVSTVICALTGLKIDGWMGLIVALIVLKAGYEVCKDTIDRLLGGKPDPEKSAQLRELLMEYEEVLGVHDLIIHDYGPGRCFASVHAEVSDQSNIVTIHEVIDQAEREIGGKMRMPICIHMDPIADGDGLTAEVRANLSEFLAHYDPCLTLHDFRMVMGQEQINLIFDVVLPAGYKNKAALHEALVAHALSLDPRYRLVVQYDTDFT